jgi:hypothetical protein
MEKSHVGTAHHLRINRCLSLFSLLVLALSAVSILTVASNANATPQSPPPQVSLVADPMAVGYEGTSTLSWFTTYAESCTAHGAWSGTKPTAGTEAIGPLTKTRKFALKCTGPGGIVKRWIKVVVGSPTAAPTLSLTADSQLVDSTTPITLTWNATNATSCQAGGAWSQEKGLTGSETIGPLDQTRTFNLKCDGPGGSVKRWLTINVTGASTPSPAPTAFLTADPETVDYLGSSTMTWGTTDTTACTASGDWGGDKPTNGTEVMQHLAETGTYNLECDGPGGDVISSVTIAVNPPPPPAPTVSLAAEPLSVDYDGSTTLTWTSTAADECVASGNWKGIKATSGTKIKKSLTDTSTFTLTCNGTGGSASQSVTVTVGAAPLPAVSLRADPTTVGVNGYSTLTWSSTSAASCLAGNAWAGEKPTSGSEDVGPLAQTSTFTLTCTGPGGSANRPVTVTVEDTSFSAELSWIAPTVNEDGSPASITAFNIYAGTSHTSLFKVATVPAAQTTFTVNGLQTGTTYFAVTAVSDTAESAFSNIESKTTF